MQFSDDYLDLRDNPTTLTQAELDYFHQTADMVRAALGIQVEIVNRNHEELDGKHKEALGVFYTSDPKNPTMDCFISIDNYFIHECYDQKFNGGWHLNFETLEGVMCHEIAHMTKFRHCKSHTSLTEEYLRRVEAYCSKDKKASLAEQISRAEEKSSLQATGKERTNTIDDKQR